MQVSIGMTLTRGSGALYTWVLLLDEQDQAVEDDEAPGTYWITTSIEDEASP